MYSIQHYVIKFVSDFAVGQWFSPGNPVSSPNNADHLDITEILLKVVLNTVTTTLYLLFQYVKRGGRDHMVVEFITTYVISAYH